DWGWLTPDPERAGQDRPGADVDHCQVDEHTDEPVRCDFGPASPTTVALVGDSKAMQWLPAIQRVADDHSWHVVTYGKSSCAFSAGGAALAGRPYPSCDRWSMNVLRRLLADPPAPGGAPPPSARPWDGPPPAPPPAPGPARGRPGGRRLAGWRGCGTGWRRPASPWPSSPTVPRRRTTST